MIGVSASIAHMEAQKAIFAEDINRTKPKNI